jgi:hypothetical protein
VDWWFENNRCPANWSASYDNDAQIVGDHVDFSFRSVGDACGCAKRHFERSLLDYGPGKRVQTGTARTMACAEVSIPTRDGAACAYSQSKIVRPPSATDPGYVYVPQTGQTFQNLPSLPGSARGGAETFQDRAIRCTHQAGVYGQVGANRGSYMGSCL